MLLRIYGIAALLAGAVAVFFAWKGIQGTHALGSTLTQVMSYQKIAFDPPKWADHYRAYWAIWMVVGVAAMLAGIAMLYRARWGIGLFAACSLALLLYPIALQLSGMQQYGFERISYGQEAVLTVVFGLTIFGAFCLKRHGPVH
jgi:hypothetical protein